MWHSQTTSFSQYIMYTFAYINRVHMSHGHLWRCNIHLWTFYWHIVDMWIHMAKIFVNKQRIHLNILRHVHTCWKHMQTYVSNVTNTCGCIGDTCGMSKMHVGMRWRDMQEHVSSIHIYMLLVWWNDDSHTTSSIWSFMFLSISLHSGTFYNILEPLTCSGTCFVTLWNKL